MKDFKDYLYVTSSSIYIQKEMGSTTTFTRTVYVPPYLLDPHNDCKHAVPQILCELYCDICAYCVYVNVAINTMKHSETRRQNKLCNEMFQIDNFFALHYLS